MLKPRRLPGRKNWCNPHEPSDRVQEIAMRRWKMMLPTATLTVVPFAFDLPSANAFFPPIVSTPPVSVVDPPANPAPVLVVPPVSPPPFVVVPPVSPPPVIVVPPTAPPSSAVPEPSSLVAGIAGLCAAAGWAKRRRKQAA